MSQFLILGAGPLGQATATALLELGHTVLVGTRSGTKVPGTTTLTIDASDPDALTKAATDCEAMVVCTNPTYHKWATEWPPIIDSAIVAARKTGCRIVLAGNLYAFGPNSGVMSEQTPQQPLETKGKVRAQLWEMLEAASKEYGIAVAELRASDYFGPNAGNNAHLGDRFMKPVRNGATARIIGDPNAPHSWSYIPDIGQCLAILATQPELSGRFWVGPKSGDASMREIAASLNAKAKVKQLAKALLWILSLFSPTLREVFAIRYQFTEPFILDDSELRREFNFTPTPLKEALQKSF
ncbi:NAD-dependent epimerase/dehydratase family protein [Corynebacterium freiburgense]|uniref:NAD-dependent epimerase/dehydratase family protein n=1 Tax=Corynebacterium freiburgense TaxID=556548 RepID=UPI0003FB6F0E|nr:NAD-dependent epimerase/dehydratase family protein [Corynebacterium freiburgense]WJZ01838.1 NAD dependent epimerase/dehydratase family protein [Corynebacterium freiburgense]